jgi:osmotically-inducible protein OsmY
MGETSEKIKKNIIDHLNWDIRIDAEDIQIEVSNGNVRLSGTVPTMTARIAAVGDVYAIPGVKTVKNELKVRFTKDIPRDEDIRSRIKNILLWNSDIDLSDIDISVLSGHVTLKGNVRTYWDKIQTEKLISNIVGVSSINNELIVVPLDRIEDKLIGSNIATALDRVSYLEKYLDTVYIKVEDGKVVVSGDVPDSSIHHAVLDTISCTTGVKDVIDNLMVNQDSQLP